MSITTISPMGGAVLTGKHLEEAERLAVEIAEPLPAIMSLVAANDDVSRPAIMSLLQIVNDKAADLDEALSSLRKELEPLS